MIKLLKDITILFFSLSVFTLGAQSTYSGDKVAYDFINSDQIKSCILSPLESSIDFPVIEMDSPERLLLQFDDLGSELMDYMYTISHCNADWTLSELHASEFIDGFSENYIENYEFSFNTKVPYIHYDLVLPNQDFQFKKSGNYIISVYNSQQPDVVLFTKRFMVYEKKLLIASEVHQATLAKGRFTDHEIDLVVNFLNVDYVNPIRDVQVAIYQGHNWSQVIRGLKPSFVEKKRLVYDFEEELSFKAGNEYRFFDTKSVRYKSENIQEIISGTTDVFLLYPDYPRVNKVYSFYNDIEGYYVPNIMDKRDSRIQADYVGVNFCLKNPSILDEGDLYVYGGLTDWVLKEEAKLVYDAANACYETSMLLKQGYYNYTYVFVADKTEGINSVVVDGSFYQTGQDYHVFVYLYDYDYGYDRLLGVKKLTTRGVF